VLKGIIRVGSSSSRTNYNGGFRSTGFSIGVVKKELNIAKRRWRRRQRG
jgi:hypothetical protein